MKAFAELLDRLAYTPSRNDKLRLLAGYFASAPGPRTRLGARSTHRRVVLQAAAAAHTHRSRCRARRSGVVRPVARLCRRHGRDHRPDLAGRRERRQAAAACGHRRGASVDAACRDPSAPRRLARYARCHRPVGAAQASDGGAPRRRLGTTRQDRACRMVGRRSRRYRGGLARAAAALYGVVRLALRVGTTARRQLARDLPAADAVAPDRGQGARVDRAQGLRRRMEMGRHPRAGRPPRRRDAAVLAHRRRYLRCVSRCGGSDPRGRWCWTASCW